MLYRIYTEDKHDGVAESLAALSFDALTIIRTEGYWKGQSEDSMIIEVLTDCATTVRLVAEKIRRVNDQEAVLITCHPVDSLMVSRPEFKTLHTTEVK